MSFTGETGGPGRALAAEDIVGRLAQRGFYSVNVRGSVPSTNTLLKERAEAGEREGAAVIACAQTAGRGRMGRSFYSPCDTGLYMSVLLKPALSAQETLLITPAAAVAAARAVETVCKTETGIKWVNDLYTSEGKVAGILTEGAFDASGALRYAVAGIGVNIAPPKGGFPETAGNAAALGGAADMRAALAAAILDELYALYTALPDRAFMQEYRRRCFVIGRRVLVLLPQGGREAVVMDVDDDAALLVRYDDGVTARIAAGEISISTAVFLR